MLVNTSTINKRIISHMFNYQTEATVDTMGYMNEDFIGVVHGLFCATAWWLCCSWMLGIPQHLVMITEPLLKEYSPQRAKELLGSSTSLTQDELAKVETKLVEAATQVSTMTAERQQFIYQIDYILLAASREQGNHVKN